MALAIAVTVALLLALVVLLLLLRLRRDLASVRRASAALANGGLFGLDQVLREQGLQVRQTGDRLTELERRLQQSDQRLGAAIRRVGIVRFNPFRESGGDQSFTVAFLNDEGAGVVLTGLHNRADTRVFAKPVQQRTSRYPLSDEEVRAIAAAFDETAERVAE